MIRLRKMRADEFPAYRDYFIADYSEEIIQNYGRSQDTAILVASEDLQESFPNGPDGDEHDLLCVDLIQDDNVSLIGYLWHSINKSELSTFIYDFYISEKYRSHGYGTKAINEFEKILAAMNIAQIKLRVAYHNKRALSLYESVGFKVSGFNMHKKLNR